ncbi:MAG: saccharopine dehydrogenase NADP-binding domain-containing protein [Polaromonas sp.]|nr:saccharopine dehydrogenase NADP-binding domain-containing protein [Polaromonas sp.]
MPSKRSYDVILYGATGFVGRQTVEYFAHSAAVKTHGLRWALAGRNQAKLEQVREGCAGAADAGIVVAAADDAKALDALAKSTRVVLSTAGPFALYGSALVAACVKHGTHYVDITGETPWVASMIEQHHMQAAENGTRIIPFCGFDSVPSDIGTWLITQAMQQRHGVPCVDVAAAFTLRGGVNGGTLASLFNIMGSGQAKLLANPFLLNPTPASQKQIAANSDPVMPRYDAQFKAWLGPFFMSAINSRVVRRSAAMLHYGDDFSYQEYLRLGRGLLAGPTATSLSVSMGMSKVAMGFSAVRRVAAMLIPKPGEGPSETRMHKGFFRCELVGKSASGQVVRGRVQDQGDPGNRATTKMVCEAALCLVIDHEMLPGGAGYGGVLTPATGLGDVLVRRLRGAGMTLVVDES